MDLSQIRRDASSLVPEMVEELRALVGQASIAFEGFPGEPVELAGRSVADLMTRSGFAGVRMLDVGPGHPAVYADMPGPRGSPTVLLYAHYDVQPAPLEAGWESDPWILTEREGRLYGRGAADDKSGIVIHAATMRLFHGNLPVGIKLVIEGEEEAASHLEEFVAREPDLFRADVFVSADNGNLIAGQPVLETTLRGDVTCYVEARTLDHPVHSGLFGGAAPDALVALIRVLKGLWAEDGTMNVPGLRRFDWPGREMPEDLFRETAAVRAGVGLIGAGSLSTRLWSAPSATVIGLDAPAVAAAANVLVSSARAKIGMRIAPDADARRELEILMDFLRSRAPAWAEVEVTPGKATNGFVMPQGGRALEAARAALRDGFGAEPSDIGGGGGIPLLGSLQVAFPDAEFVLWGAQDLKANAHGPNENVDPLELERMIVSQASLLGRLGDGPH